MSKQAPELVKPSADATDQELRAYIDALIFPTGRCEKCQCPNRHHDWWIAMGEVRCRSCFSGIAMAQVAFGGQRRCYIDIYPDD